MSEHRLPTLSWRVIFNRANPPDMPGWGRVRAAQLRAVAPSLTLAAWGTALNSLILAVMLWNTATTGLFIAWFGVIGLLLALAYRFQRRIRKRDIHSVPRKLLDNIGHFGAFFAFAWVFPARFLFGLADHGEQLAICITTAALMAGAVFIFRAIPVAAAAYVIVIGTAATLMLSSTGAPLITAIPPLYTVGLLFMIHAGGRSFMHRKCLDFQLEERTETVSLLLREFEDSDADWLWHTNSQLCFHTVSARFARAIGRDQTAMESLSFPALIEDAARAAPGYAFGLLATHRLLDARAPISNLVLPLEVDGVARFIELSARPRYNRQGRFLGYQGVGSDITAARQAADHIAHMARHDALTGLPNRLHLLESLDAALGGADEETRCAVMLVDLDRFKTINDSLGHVAGDELLRQVADCLRQVIERDMVPGRLGGDEFAIIVPAFSARAELERLSEAVISSLQGPFHHDDQRLFVGASIGIAIGPGDGNTVEELIRNADLALYRAKASGGNDICFYEPSLHAQADERRRMELALRSALDESEFHLVYQPIVDAGSSRIESFEALLRWSSPVFGDVSPMRFIPLAEETGLIGRIGEWVLRTACAEAARWPRDISIAINVSPRQLQDPAFVVTLISAVTQAGLDPHRLELEVTETVFLELTNKTQKVLNQIQGFGVRLAMDDFGTGYSSLGYLRKAEFDTLKIDRSFINGLDDDDPESGAIIRAVVALAGSLGMKTVAEGVSTKEQLDQVRLLGCDRIQGYLYSRPVPAAGARALLAGNGVSAAA